MESLYEEWRARRDDDSFGVPNRSEPRVTSRRPNDEKGDISVHQHEPVFPNCGALWRWHRCTPPAAL